MRKLYLLVIIFIAYCSSASANNKLAIGNIVFKNATIDPDPAPTADFKTLIVPIKRAGNLIVIEASVDTLEGNFVLDTGAPYLILNETYFRNYPQIENKDVTGITGASAGSFATYVHNFSILDLQYSRLTAQVTDLSFIENGRNIKILGLLGTRLFSKFALTVDLFRNVLYIQKLDKDGNIPETEKVYHDRFMISPFRFLNDVIFLKGDVNNNTYWFAFDTAAETNLLDYQKTKKISSSMQIIGRSKLTGVGGSIFEVVYARFDELIVGDRTFMRNRVLLTSLEKMGNSYGYNVDCVLGYDFFSRGIFTINFAKKEFEMYIYTAQ
jgi:Aspartyl protease